MEEEKKETTTEAVIRLYKEGLSQRKVAQSVHWSVERVVNLLLENAIEIRPYSKRTDESYNRMSERNAKIYELSMGGMPVADIARKYQRSRARISEIIEVEERRRADGQV